MNILKNVIDKIAESDKKTELASQKVELGLVDDLNKALQDSDAIIKDIRVDDERILTMQKSINRDLKDREKLLTNRKKAEDKYFDLEDKFLAAKRQLEDVKKGLVSNEDRIEVSEKEIAKAEKSKAPKVKRAQKALGVFEKNLAKAEAAAKDLGIKLPIAKYKKAQDNLRKSIS